MATPVTRDERHCFTAQEFVCVETKNNSKHGSAWNPDAEPRYLDLALHAGNRGSKVANQLALKT